MNDFGREQACESLRLLDSSDLLKKCTLARVLGFKDTRELDRKMEQLGISRASAGSATRGRPRRDAIAFLAALQCGATHRCCFCRSRGGEELATLRAEISQLRESEAAIRALALAFGVSGPADEIVAAVLSEKAKWERGSHAGGSEVQHVPEATLASEAISGRNSGARQEGQASFLERYYRFKVSGGRKIPDDVLPPLMYLSFMGEGLWEEVRFFWELPCWRTMQRKRKRVMKLVFPVENPLSGSVEALDALTTALPSIYECFTLGRGGCDEMTMVCDALQTKPWLGVDRAGVIHGGTDAARGDFVPAVDLSAVFEEPSAFAELASRRVVSRKVTHACFVIALTSTAPGSPTLPVRLIRAASGKANDGIAEEIHRLYRFFRAKGIPLERMAMDGDNVFVRMLDPIWSVMRRAKNWHLHLDISNQNILLSALHEYGRALSDPSHWIKAFRCDKLKPGRFYLIGPVQAGYWFDSTIFPELGFARGDLLNDSASKMDYGLAARFVRYKHLKRIRKLYDGVVASIRGEMACVTAGILPGSVVEPDSRRLDTLRSLLGRYASAYWALVPAVCLHLVTCTALAPEDRLTVSLYGLATMLLIYWDRERLSPLEGDIIPLQKRNPRSEMGMHIWAHREECVKKCVPTVFDLALSIATTTVPIRASAYGSMGIEHYFGFLRRMALYDQRADVLADRAELSLLKLWLRAKLQVPARVDDSKHREGDSGVVFEPMGPGALLPPLSLSFAQVKQAMGRMGIDLLLAGHVEALPEWAPCFLEDLVALPKEREPLMATSVSWGPVRVPAVRHQLYHATAAQLHGA